jgi:hypothetical protein
MPVDLIGGEVIALVICIISLDHGEDVKSKIVRGQGSMLV